MRRYVSAIFLSLLFGQLSIAQEAAPPVNGSPSVVIDEEVFSKKTFDILPQGDKLMGFVREAETFDKWTKRVAFKRQSFGTDPKVVANRMAQVATLFNGQAQASVFVDEQASEAYVDYKSWPEGNRFTELNIFRIAKSKDGKAVVSLHLACRIPPSTSGNAEEMKRIRASWLKQASTFDMKSVFAALGE